MMYMFYEVEVVMMSPYLRRKDLKSRLLINNYKRLRNSLNPID